MGNQWLVERLDPKGLSTFSQCIEILPNSCPPDLELGALTKMASQPEASLSLGRLLYSAPSNTDLVLYMGLVQQRSTVCRDTSGK